MAASLQVKELNEWHNALIDYIIANPTASLRLKARQFNVSISWLSIVENSDAFKEKMKARQDAHFENVSIGVVRKLEAVADTVLDEINFRLDKDNGASIPLAQLKELGDMALKNLGFGNKFGPRLPNEPNPLGSSTTNNTIIVADRESLKDARAMMESLRAQAPAVDLEQKKVIGPIVEGEVVSIRTESSAPED